MQKSLVAKKLPEHDEPGNSFVLTQVHERRRKKISLDPAYTGGEAGLKTINIKQTLIPFLRNSETEFRSL
jgi:hypothetical protein